MTALLDANVLVALTVSDHVHHHAVAAWFARLERSFATCPITQGALLRLLLRDSVPVSQAQHVLSGVTTHQEHRFWPDDRDYRDVSLAGVVGHRQVTDAYLAGLARYRKGVLVTLDGGLAVAHPDVGELIDPGETGTPG